MSMLVGVCALVVAIVFLAGCGPSAMPAAPRDHSPVVAQKYAAGGRVTDAYLDGVEWWNQPPQSNDNYGYAAGSSAVSREDAVDDARRELVMQQGVFIRSYQKILERGTLEDHALDILISRISASAADLPNTGVRRYHDIDTTHHALVELDMAALRSAAEANRREALRALEDGRRARAVGNIRVSIRAYLHALALAYERLVGSDADRPEGTAERLSVTIERQLQALIGDLTLDIGERSKMGILGEPLPEPVVVFARMNRRPARDVDIDFVLRGAADTELVGGFASDVGTVRSRTGDVGSASCQIGALRFLGPYGELVATVVLDPLLDEVTSRIDSRLRPKVESILATTPPSTSFRFESMFAGAEHRGLQASFPNASPRPVFPYGKKQTLAVRLPRACTLYVMHLDQDGDLNFATALTIHGPESHGGYRVTGLAGGGFEVIFDNMSLGRESTGGGGPAREAIVLIASSRPLGHTPGTIVDPVQLRRDLDAADPGWLYDQLPYCVR